MKISGRHLAVVAAMCGVSVASIGLVINISGLFFTPMAEEFGILQGTSSMLLTVTNIAMAIGGLATRPLAEKIPFRLLLIAATVLLAGSTAALGIAPNIGVAYLFAVLKGLGSGVTGFVIIALTLNKWFDSQTGLVTSIAMGCSGIGGAVFSPIIQSAIGAFGWRSAWMIVGVLMVLFMLPSIVLIPSFDPRGAGLLPFGADEGQAVAGDTPAAPAQKAEVDQVIFALTVAYALLCGSVASLPQHFPGIATTAGFATAGAMMISACMVTNTAGKVLMGWLCDRIGAKRTVLAYCAVIALALLIFLFIPAVLPYAGAAFFMGLSYSLGSIGLTAVCRELFGEAGSAVVYPVGAMAYNLSNAIFSSAIGYSFDWTGAYTVAFIGLLAIIAVVFGLTLAAYARGPESARTSA